MKYRKAANDHNKGRGFCGFAYGLVLSSCSLITTIIATNITSDNAALDRTSSVITFNRTMETS